MSSARAQANHKLYLAKIQLAGWQRASEAHDIPAVTLAQAFLPAVRAHLLDAYGWFLLAVSGAEQFPDNLPRRCAELPGTAVGKAVPGEIREFALLENEGWLAGLLQPPDEAVRATRAPGNLAVAAPAGPDCDQAQHWINQLEALFDRMSDSLDEY